MAVWVVTLFEKKICPSLENTSHACMVRENSSSFKKNQNENMIFFCFEKATKELYIEIYF